jgi:hypothetical protein
MFVPNEHARLPRTDSRMRCLPPGIWRPASDNVDILTPRFPTRRSRGPARLILRSQRIQLWLKDESVEDSANLPVHCHPEFPASLDTLKVSVPPAVKLAPCQR